MKKIRRNIFIIVFCAVILASGVIGYVWASAYLDKTENSNIIKVDKYEYQYNVYPETTTDRITVSAELKTTNGEKTPGGYMSAQARLYDQNGTLVSSSELFYENNSISELTMTTYLDTSEYDSTYWAQGMFDICEHARSYVTVYDSCAINGTDEVPAFGDYGITDNGETYGSGIMAEVCGEFPDLIEAKGDSGKVGYIRNNDLIYNVTTLSLYDLNGNIVDTFTFNSEKEDAVD